VRYDNVHTGLRLANFEAHRAVAEDRFFYKEDATILRATRQQMLRTLVNKVPSEMGKADEIR
jgi:hypothetical protein